MLQSIRYEEIIVVGLLMIRSFAILFPIPYLSSDLVGTSIKAGLAFFLAICLYPVVRSGMTIDLANNMTLITAVIMEFLLGMMLAFIVKILFAAIEFGADAAGIQMGLGAAQAFDPTIGSMTTDFSSLLVRVSILLFLVLNFDHYFIQALYFSLKTIPIGSFTVHQPVFYWIVSLSFVIPTLAFQIVAPIIVVILLIHVAFGLVSKSVPSINIFFISTIVTIFIGLGVYMFSLPYFAGVVEKEFFKMNEEIFYLIKTLGSH